MKITYEFDNFFCFFLSLLLATENLENHFFSFFYFSFWWYIANKKKDWPCAFSTNKNMYDKGNMLKTRSALSILWLRWRTNHLQKIWFEIKHLNKH